MPSPDRRLEWSFVGSLPYGRADALQRALRDLVRHERQTDYLLLLEHPHVYTLGRNADRQDILVDREWLASRGAEVVESDRGGKVTYHGPGQLVGYPIIDLSPDRRDLRRYVHDLLEVLVRTLQEIGIDGEPRHVTEEIGVWVENRKIASIGVHVSRWITTHGFALNVHTDLSFFSSIVPCGLEGVEMTSVEGCAGRRRDLAEVAARCAHHFGEVFGCRLTRVPASKILEPCPIEP
jgi:lipoyl(octanoyl) transferase